MQQSQTVLFNQLPAHMRHRAKRQARKLKFTSLADAVADLMSRDTFEGQEYWQGVTTYVSRGAHLELSLEEEIVQLAVKATGRIDYKNLNSITGINIPELKTIMVRLRALNQI